MVEVLVAELEEEDEKGEDELIFQGVVSPVFIFLGKNGKFLNVQIFPLMVSLDFITMSRVILQRNLRKKKQKCLRQ